MPETYDELGMSREELLKKIAAMVKPSRYQHMLGVEATAAELAKRYGGDVHQAALAGLLHDYAKEVSKEEFLALIDKYSLDPELKNWGNAVWHGKVGWLKIKEDFKLDNPEILHAIEVHTTGDKKMSLLDKIVYVADYIEPNRDFPGVEEAREIAKQSLNAAVAYETAGTTGFLVEKRVPIYPQTFETYNAFIKYLQDGKFEK